MPTPRERPMRFTPRTVSDTVDGDNSKPGAFSLLTNLIWDPSTPGALQCRPAHLKLSSFAGLSIPGVVTAAFQLGGLIYGMIGSALHSGKDQPFVYNIGTAAFETVTGITAANTPTTPATSGAWVPPTMDMVGSRIYVTHPGFNFSAGYSFGYFDISGFSANIVGDVVNGSPTINGNFSIAGLGPGYTLSGTDITAGTTVVNTGNVAFTVTGTTHSNTTVDGIASTTGMFVGQAIAGTGIPTGTTIATITSSVAITISQAATASATVPLSITGTTITMSANATGTLAGGTIAVAGGTAASPLWAAGNTTGALQIAGVASAVRQFSNRAYFAQGNNLIYTDTLSTNVSNASGVQVLTLDDSTPITALCGLPMYTTTGGVLQALIAYKQFSIWQVTGDAALGNLSLNQISGTVGTAAPRSVQVAPSGQYFVASDGVRTVNLIGEVSEVDPDLALPFIYAETPSRISGAYNADIYRLCTQNTNVNGAPFQVYHYAEKYNGWTGPHSFREDLAVAYLNDFVVFNTAVPATMWEAFTVQDQNSQGNTFVENGTQLTWAYETCPMTDDSNMYLNCAVRSTLDLALPGTGDTYLFQAIDVNVGTVAQASIMTPLSEAIWDAFNWGDGTLWGAAQYGLQPITIPWTKPPIFNKLVFSASGNSALGFKVGSVYTGYEKLNYMKPQ